MSKARQLLKRYESCCSSDLITAIKAVRDLLKDPTKYEEFDKILSNYVGEDSLDDFAERDPVVAKEVLRNIAKELIERFPTESKKVGLDKLV